MKTDCHQPPLGMVVRKDIYPSQWILLWRKSDRNNDKTPYFPHGLWERYSSRNSKTVLVQHLSQDPSGNGGFGNLKKILQCTWSCTWTSALATWASSWAPWSRVAWPSFCAACFSSQVAWSFISWAISDFTEYTKEQSLGNSTILLGVSQTYIAHAFIWKLR